RNFFISFYNTAKTLTETVFIQFFLGVFVPQTATVWRELITQHNTVMENTKFKLEIHQNHIASIEQCFEHIIHLISQFFHFFQLFSIGPTQSNRLRSIDHWIAQRIIFKEQFKCWWSQLFTFFYTQTAA